jgi:serine/threonine protein kinase
MLLNLKTETVFTDDTPAAQPPLPPEQFAPHFPQLEILESLGRGGMGVVYKARQKSLNRLVALKLLAPERVRDAKFAERFTREAQALAALNHPNIVTIYDFGQAGGFYYLLMEFVDGVNLRQLLRTQKLTPEEALAIVPQICAALQFAHDRGIVHRDIKPENLLLDKAGRVKVADFGIAKMLGTSNGDSGVGELAAPENTTQAAIGTPSYSAPEQKSDPQHVDSRADIYSLGVVFYEMLTGELPGKRLEPPSKKVQIDVRLDEIVLRALERKPELRYQQVSEVKTLVETIVATKLDSTVNQSAINEAEWRNPQNWTSTKWKWPAIYFSKRDSRILVPKLLPGLGWTVNLGNLRGAFTLFAIFITVIIIILAVKPAGPLIFHTSSIKSDYIGQPHFPQGDSIEITVVERSKDQMTVKGHYNLVSHDQAALALYTTTTNISSSTTDPKQEMHISKGSGNFELTHPHLVPGLPHVSMYPVAGGEPFAELYFGTEAEASGERKLNLGHPQVVSVSPADGATNVDVMQELHVRFDRPMNSNDWEISWLAGGFLPNGQPHYELARNEFVIPVRLLPGRTNKLEVNWAGKGFRDANFVPADKFIWYFVTKPTATKPGALKPNVVHISPAAGGMLPLLTLLEVTFDQPMMPPDQSFPYLEQKGWLTDLPAIIPCFDYDTTARRFTIPLVLPPDNETKLKLSGFYSADGVPSDPVVLRCEIGTNNYSSQQLDLISTAAKDPQLEQLLSSMKAARARLNSGVETVTWTTLLPEVSEAQSFGGISIHSSIFKWQGTNQVYADISGVMETKTFILGNDGNTCWLFSDNGQNGYSHESSPAALVPDIYTSVADPFALTRHTVQSAIAQERLIYDGEAQLDGHACHRVQSWLVKQPPGKHDDLIFAAKLEWWIDADTLLPVRVVQYTQYGCQTFNFHFEHLNQPLAITEFQPPAATGTNARPDAFKLFKQAIPAPGEKRFLTIKDGSSGEMSGRLGRRGPDGTTSSGLN